MIFPFQRKSECRYHLGSSRLRAEFEQCLASTADFVVQASDLGCGETNDFDHYCCCSGCNASDADGVLDNLQGLFRHAALFQFFDLGQEGFAFFLLLDDLGAQNGDGLFCGSFVGDDGGVSCVHCVFFRYGL